MIHYWMILSMLVNHPKLDDLYDPLLNDYASSNNTIFNNVQQLQCDVVAIASVLFITWGGVLAFALPMVYDYRDHNAAWTCVDGDGLGVQVLLMLNVLWVHKIVLG